MYIGVLAMHCLVSYNAMHYLKGFMYDHANLDS